MKSGRSRGQLDGLRPARRFQHAVALLDEPARERLAHFFEVVNH
jgi:hypothetical protein